MHTLLSANPICFVRLPVRATATHSSIYYIIAGNRERINSVFFFFFWELRERFRRSIEFLFFFKISSNGNATKAIYLWALSLFRKRKRWKFKEKNLLIYHLWILKILFSFCKEEMKIQRKGFNLWTLLFSFCKEEIKIQRKGSLDITTIVFISQGRVENKWKGQKNMI